ncbi:hypothetical protein ACHAL6_10850 [Proteiniclasticum sp. C24MP]|uniref:hypothetical protein n=1 Tax=Proteiniclasticum sp. C24MP TaxID=3374101 RepID=UPI0037551BE3
MDFIVIALSFFAIVVVLKIMKSAFKFVLTVAILFFIAYYLDLQGIIDISPFLDMLGI